VVLCERTCVKVDPQQDSHHEKKREEDDCTSGRDQNPKVPFLCGFPPFFLHRHKIMCHRDMFFMWKKSQKNVACYCKIVTLHPICCRVLSPPQPVHCHFVNTRSCKFPLIFHVVYHIHKSIYILCFESSFWFEMDWWSYLERGSLHMSVGVFSQCVVCFHLSMWLITFLCALSHSIRCYTFFLCIPSY
jgi:hypothetical protein